MKKQKSIPLFDMLDEACASRLKVDVQTFIEKIESTTEWRADVIIQTVLDENSTEKQLKKAARCFNLIK